MVVWFFPKLCVRDREVGREEEREGKVGEGMREEEGGRRKEGGGGGGRGKGRRKGRGKTQRRQMVVQA